MIFFMRSVEMKFKGWNLSCFTYIIQIKYKGSMDSAEALKYRTLTAYVYFIALFLNFSDIPTGSTPFFWLVKASKWQVKTDGLCNHMLRDIWRWWLFFKTFPTTFWLVQCKKKKKKNICCVRLVKKDVCFCKIHNVYETIEWFC